jgi:hypothetical protein
MKTPLKGNRIGFYSIKPVKKSMQAMIVNKKSKDLLCKADPAYYKSGALVNV